MLTKLEMVQQLRCAKILSTFNYLIIRDWVRFSYLVTNCQLGFSNVQYIYSPLGFLKQENRPPAFFRSFHNRQYMRTQDYFNIIFIDKLPSIYDMQ